MIISFIQFIRDHWVGLSILLIVIAANIYYFFFKPHKPQVNPDMLNDDKFWDEVSRIDELIKVKELDQDLMEIDLSIRELKEKFKATRRLIFLDQQSDILFGKLYKKMAVYTT